MNGEGSVIQTKQRLDDDRRIMMNESHQLAASGIGTDDKTKSQHNGESEQLKQAANDKRAENTNGHNTNSSEAHSTTTSNGKRPKTVCFDFKKGLCRRRYCRYPHVMSADQVVFCHDFQNTGCFRQNCRFIHQSIEEEEYYRQFGVFPLPNERSVVGLLPEQQIPASLPPIAVNSLCQQAQQQQQSQSQQQQQQQQQQFHQNNCQPQQISVALKRRPYDTMEVSKRSRIDDIPRTMTQYNNQRNEQQQPPQPQQQQIPITTTPVTSVVIGEDVINIYRLYEEHNLLRRRVEINEERLQELRATNTYLLHQNEQLRRQSQCSCTSTIVNPVTLTTASQQSAAQPQVINAVSIAPVQMQATPIVSIASIAQPQTQIISSTPLAIAANTSQGQQLALASTQQAAHAGQILGTSQITLATAPSMGITMNTSQPLAMSANATQPIISYPVMTHSILPH